MPRPILRPALLLVGLAAGLILAAPGTRAVGDLRPVTFAEDVASEGLRRRLARQPRGRLHWIVAEPLLAMRPVIRGAGVVYALRSGTTAELLELAPTGVVRRRFTLEHRPAAGPTVDRLGALLIPATNGQLMTVEPETGTVRSDRMGYGPPSPLAVGPGNQLYATSRFGLLIALRGRSGISWQGRPLATGPVSRRSAALPSPPAVAADGSIYVCGGVGRVLLKLGADGKEIWSRPALDCPNAPLVTPDGRVVVSGHGGLQIFDEAGALRATVPLAGRGGQPVLAADGGILVVTTTGALAAVTTAGVLRWSFPVGASDPPPEPAVGPQGISVASPEGHVVTLDPAGAVRWSVAVPRPSPLLAVRADGGVYVVSTGHSVRLVSGPAPRKNARRAN